MKTISRKKKIYCTTCGTKLTWKQDNAEKYREFSSLSVSWKFNKFNSETGKQQIVGWWECPKKRWWNCHTSTIEKLL